MHVSGKTLVFVKRIYMCVQACTSLCLGSWVFYLAKTGVCSKCKAFSCPFFFLNNTVAALVRGEKRPSIDSLSHSIEIRAESTQSVYPAICWCVVAQSAHWPADRHLSLRRWSKIIVIEGLN